MDSVEGSRSVGNAVNRNNTDRRSSYKVTVRHEAASAENADITFGAMVNPIQLPSFSQNGPHSARSTTSTGPQSERLSENAESCRNCCETNQSIAPNKVNNVASCSKADSNTSDNRKETYQEVPVCQRHKVCFDKVGNSNSFNSPSTSANKICDNNESLRENRKRPSSLKLNRPNLDADDSSSDTANEDYSLGSEDGCIYTYRGGEHLADLPSSFFSLDMGLPVDRHLPMHPNYPVQAAQNAREHGSRASSPDMDFLEMDFDPGPSCEVDSGEESTPDVDLEAVDDMPEECEPIRGTSPEYVPVIPNPPAAVQATISVSQSDANSYNVPSTSRGLVSIRTDEPEGAISNHSYGPYITHTNVRGEQILVRRTMSHGSSNVPASLHCTGGDSVSPIEIMIHVGDAAEGVHSYQINHGEKHSTLYHMKMAKKLLLETVKVDSGSEALMGSGASVGDAGCSTTSEGAACLEVPRSMVWSEREACERQVTQIATSACGATAVINVFNALGVPVNLEKINSAVGTRQRANNAPLPRYLLSRAMAGCTAADLVNGIQNASDGLVTARFFPMYPERAMSLSHWLADWISLGAVPILTLNLQVGAEGEIPDAWHHQMVFGVSSRGVYLCNPIECVRESVLWPRLTSPSVLLVRSSDVLSRFTPSTDLTPLLAVPDRRFHTFNVLGQVVNVIREGRASGWSEVSAQARHSSHIRLPASYRAGVTLGALTGSEAHRRLVHAPHPPLVGPNTIGNHTRLA